MQTTAPITLREAARRAEVHVETVRRWSSAGVRGAKLETWLVGGRRRTSQEAIDRFLRSINGRCIPAPADADCRRRIAAKHGI